MKNKKLNAELIWKQFEDLLVPRLRLSVVDRAVYSHLLRHSRLEGKLRLRFSIARIARGIRLSNEPAREAVRRLVEQGALRLVERSKAGHVVEVRLPEEIRGVHHDGIATRGLTRQPHAASLEEMDFLKTKALRQANSLTGARPLLLLSALADSAGSVPRPRGAARPPGWEFLPQPRLLLFALQFAEKGPLRQ
jgi:predicted DNA-binding transcriptional regulator